MIPQFTVVTPTLNAARWLPRTLESLASQRAVSYEHIVIDGGSRDDTAALARASGARVEVLPGRRQAAALNAGAALARGELIVVLNADDVLMPGALSALSGAAESAAGVIYGEAVHIDAEDRVVGRYPTGPADRESLSQACTICNPAAAVRRVAMLQAGGFDERLDLAFDYDLWIRLTATTPFRRIADVVAGSRMHRDNKTLSRRGDLYREVFGLLREHYRYVPYAWMIGYAEWLFHRNDQFYDLRSAGRLEALAALGLGLAWNPRQPVRYARDWYRHRAMAHRTR